MITQATLIDVPATSAASNIPPQPPKPVALAEPLGECCKLGCEQEAVLKSPGGSIYCEKCGKCGAKTVDSSALGISVRVCGRSVEQFVMHERLGIWVCPCILKFEASLTEKSEAIDTWQS